MSIRGFHIVFISISSLFCVALSLWVFFLSGLSNGLGKLVFGSGAASAAVSLVVYGVYFYQKIRNLNI
jgi:hypothetical protein